MLCTKTITGNSMTCPRGIGTRYVSSCLRVRRQLVANRDGEQSVIFKDSSVRRCTIVNRATRGIPSFRGLGSMRSTRVADWTGQQRRSRRASMDPPAENTS
jgi:hypothetical protein